MRPPSQTDPPSSTWACRQACKGIDSTSHYAARCAVTSLLARKELTRPTKLGVYKTFVRPAMESGLPFLKHTKRGLDPLEAIQSFACHFILGVPKSASSLAVEGP